MKEVYLTEKLIEDMVALKNSIKTLEERLNESLKKQYTMFDNMRHLKNQNSVLIEEIRRTNKLLWEDLEEQGEEESAKEKNND